MKIQRYCEKCKTTMYYESTSLIVNHGDVIHCPNCNASYRLLLERVEEENDVIVRVCEVEIPMNIEIFIDIMNTLEISLADVHKKIDASLLLTNIDILGKNYPGKARFYVLKNLAELAVKRGVSITWETHEEIIGV